MSTKERNFCGTGESVTKSVDHVTHTARVMPDILSLALNVLPSDADGASPAVEAMIEPSEAKQVPISFQLDSWKKPESFHKFHTFFSLVRPVSEIAM